MDEMKPGHEIDAAMREIARRRDQALTSVPALSSARRSRLAAFLPGQFPIESAIHALAGARDSALHGSAQIPAAVESTLLRYLKPAAGTAEVGRAALWFRGFRPSLGAALTACALIAAALLGLARWNTSLRSAGALSNTPSIGGVNIESGLELFTRRVAIGPFNLKTDEPASLQASFFANSRIGFADGNDTPLGLRLDLPVRAALIEDGRARTP